MFEPYSYRPDGDGDVDDDKNDDDEDDDYEPGGARGGGGPRVNNLLLVADDEDREGNIPGNRPEKRVMRTIAAPLRCAGERLVVRLPPRPMFGTDPRSAFSSVNEKKMKVEDAGSEDNNDGVDGDSGGGSIHDDAMVVGGGKAVSGGGTEVDAPPPGRRGRPLKDGDVIETLNGDPHPTFAKLYDIMCRNEELVLEVAVTDGRTSKDNVGVGVGVGSGSGDEEDVDGDGDGDGRGDDRDAPAEYAVTEQVGLVMAEEEKKVKSRTMSTSTDTTSTGLRKARKRKNSRWGPTSSGNDEEILGEEVEPRDRDVLGRDEASRSSSHQDNRHGAAAAPLPLNYDDSCQHLTVDEIQSTSMDDNYRSEEKRQGGEVGIYSNELKEDSNIQRKDNNNNIGKDRNRHDDTARPACNSVVKLEGESSGGNYRAEDEESGVDDYKYELALFNMVDDQLAKVHQQRKRLKLPSLSDDDSGRVSGSAQQQGDKEEEGSPSLLHRVLAPRPWSVEMATAPASRTETSEERCCSKSAAATTTTATDSAPPSLSGDDGLNSTSFSPALVLFDCTEGNFNGEDHISLSSSSSSPSSTSSSSDSSSSSSDSSVIDNKETERERHTPTAIQASTKMKSTQQRAKILPANHLPAKRPPTVKSSIKARSSSSTTTSLSRLWPDPSDIIKALTRWTPPSVRVRSNVVHNGGTKQSLVEFYGPIQFKSTNDGNKLQWNNGSANPLLQSRRPSCNTRDQVPREFKNANDMMEILASQMVNEGLYSLNGDNQAERNGLVWKRDLYRLKMTKLTEVTPIFQSESYFGGGMKMYEAQFSSLGDTSIPPSNLSELYCMHFERWETNKFGIVAHDFPTTFSFRKDNEGKSFLRLWLVVHENEQQTKQTGWLSRKDFKKLLDPHKNGHLVSDNAILTLMSCGSTTNVVRQFEAIKSLPYLSPHLQRALFSSFIDNPSKAASTTRPRSLPVDVWRHLTNSHNSFQLKSISQVLTGSCRENVCLVQGPPGTGKSSTIVGLVTALLSGKAPLPKQRQSGCLIHPGKTMGKTTADPHARNRILVCAATNVAVDGLAWKIKNGSLGPSGKIGDFSMARFGSLPWENSRDSTDHKPEMLSAMEDFLYEVNVDRRASDGTQDFEYDDQERNEIQSWSPEIQKHNRKKRRKIVGRAFLRSQILGNCSVVVTTLSGAGSKAFIDAVCRDPTRNDSEFDAVIIDEACQASEPESLIPFKFNPTSE